MAARHRTALAELAELGLTLARDLQARALAAETADDAAALALAFSRMARCTRQSIALEAKLERDRVRAEREDDDHLDRQQKARVRVRRDQVRATVERLIWTEAEAVDDAEELVERLEELLDEDSLYDGFADGAVEAAIERICQGLGVAPPKASPAPPSTQLSGPAESRSWSFEGEPRPPRPPPPGWPLRKPSGTA